MGRAHRVAMASLAVDPGAAVLQQGGQLVTAAVGVEVRLVVDLAEIQVEDVEPAYAHFLAEFPLRAGESWAWWTFCSAG